MKILTILTTVFGVLMALGYFPQALKIYKTKSAFNISLVTFSIFALGSVFWLLHGISIHDIPLIVSSTIGVIGSWLVVLFALYYKSKK
jgi:MtN3 and saliva related transmembrane protein